MRYLSGVVAIAFMGILLLISSCTKSSSEFNLSTTGLTATFDNATAQYLVPAGLVNTTANYSLSGYEANSGTNTIVLSFANDSTASYSFAYSGSNSLVIVNNGISYSSANNRGPTVGSVSVNINGNKVTGSFSGTLYTGPTSGIYPPDSLVVTNGVISSTF